MDHSHILFIHGSGGDKSQTYKARILRGLFPGMITPDFEGTLLQRMAQLRAILEKGTGWTLIGSSLGGLMAAIIAVQLPDRVRKLVLLAPALILPEFSEIPPASIDIPTIIIKGTQDELISVKVSREIAEKTFTHLKYMIVDDDHRLHKTAEKLDWKSLLEENDKLLPAPKIMAIEMDAEIHKLTRQYTSEIRSIRRIYSQKIKSAKPEYVLEFARYLFINYSLRWIAYEIIASHKAAFFSLGEGELEEFGQGMNSWWTVDAFARTLSGPAWRNGQITDDLIFRWARSPDPWWRRAALVSTVALNLRSKGGKGDVPRTLAVCILLMDDHEDMVVKAMSWALRELIIHDPQAVRKFLDVHEKNLAARVKREVRNKLITGLKTPKYLAMSW